MARNRSKNRPARGVDYIQLSHPFTPQALFEDEAIARIHAAALALLQDQGMRVLLPEARQIFASGCPLVADDMVRIGAEIVTAALSTAPKS